VPKSRAKKRAVAKPRATPAPATKPKPRAASGVGFTATFGALKNILASFSDQLHVTADAPGKYYLVTKSKSWKGSSMHFGAVIMGKAYVSYHLMPLYTHPELIKTLSPELKKRMQGKSCFNFRAVDDALFAQLGTLTQAGLEKYRSRNWL
jgi:hypothetical protein